MSPLVLVLLVALAALCSGREQKMPPRRDELFPGEGGSLLPTKQRPLSRNYRQIQHQHHVDNVYKLPDEEVDNQVGPFEANRLVLGDPDATLLHRLGERRGGRVKRSARRPRAVFSTKFQYGRPYSAMDRLHRAL